MEKTSELVPQNIMKEFIKAFYDIKESAEELGWNVSYAESCSIYEDKPNEYGVDITFSKYIENQDFDFTISIELKEGTNCIGYQRQINDEVDTYQNDYDVSYETYLWLDNFGHGKNGAPDDMKECYEHFEKCKDEIEELYYAL
jgi:hypothetical protein